VVAAVKYAAAAAAGVAAAAALLLAWLLHKLNVDLAGMSDW
jgi:hypothetical protein